MILPFWNEWDNSFFTYFISREKGMRGSFLWLFYEENENSSAWREITENVFDWEKWNLFKWAENVFQLLNIFYVRLKIFYL